ncbi:hypothetical protein [Echinicola rosea]|uniref:DUF4131 domain-containing protein n=1 Tax=Echinicola rosea TaxID=1807691 RepID=A0ABQ1VAW8_9BACT|nr:hypothetical protein [Echinicola rosea]GGF50179.1 hypothetical protein GCM10011339_43430 [Echinicola rosea]
MEVFNFIRVISLGACLLVGLVFIVLVFAKKRNKTRHLAIAGLSLLMMYLVNIYMASLQNAIYHPPQKLGQLRFLAFGVASNGEKGWLGVYEDATWEFGPSYREIKASGTYVLKGDTIILKGDDGDKAYKNSRVLMAGQLSTQSKNANLNELKIALNNLNP